MYKIAYWVSFPQHFPDKLLSGLSIAVFLIILLISVALTQEPKKTPAPQAIPEATPTPDALIEVTPPSSMTDPDYDVVKIDVNLINLSVSVADSYDRLVPGLKKENFEVYEYDGKKKVRQNIAFFTYDDAPILIGVIPDISGSMSGDKMNYARQAIVTFLKTSNKKDDIFVMGFDEKLWIIQDSAPNDESTINNVINKLLSIKTEQGKRTALYDALNASINKIQNRNIKRLEQGRQSLKMALFIISDGQDNNSRHTFKQIKDKLKETDILIYSIVIPPSAGSEMDIFALMGKDNLKELSEITGGKAYLPDFPMSIRFPDDSILTRPSLTLHEAVTRIAFELRRQYAIAYYPTNKTRDGKYRKIYIKVIPPKGLPRLKVRSKQGYYAPKN